MKSTQFLRKTTYLIHIKDCIEFSCTGTVFDPVEQRYYCFNSLSHMILSLDALCETANWPLKECSILNIPPETILQPIPIKPRRGDICSVLTDIMYRQHSSMQGKATIYTNLGNTKTVCFRSELELMMLIQSTCAFKKRKISASPSL